MGNVHTCGPNEALVVSGMYRWMLNKYFLQLDQAVQYIKLELPRLVFFVGFCR